MEGTERRAKNTIIMPQVVAKVREVFGTSMAKLSVEDVQRVFPCSISTAKAAIVLSGNDIVLKQRGVKKRYHLPPDVNFSLPTATLSRVWGVPKMSICSARDGRKANPLWHCNRKRTANEEQAFSLLVREEEEKAYKYKARHD
jgi:hypothetical protein